MSNQDEEEALRPVIIIKRVDDDHDDHHGGVWKIAFADFMTAMMAFFLVMWLINAANEETKAQVASYFNPVKLTDAVLAPKGVKSMDATSAIELEPEEAEAQGNGPSDEKNTKASKAGTKAADTIGKTDEALFKDPYQTLKAIAGEIGDGPSAEGAVLLSRDKSGSKDTDTFRDPFDPEYRSRLAENPEQDAKQEEPKPKSEPEILQASAKEPKDKPAAEKLDKMAKADPKPEDKQKPVELTMLAKQPTEGAGKDQQAEAEQSPEMSSKKAEKVKKDAMAKKDEIAKKDEMADKEEKAKPAKDKSKRQERLDKLKKQLAHAAEQADSGKFANLSVEQSDAGLLVSLTETFGFEMFTSSSARPTAALVKLMDRISPILKQQTGPIVVRGHTDARPFKSPQYDNWRLSTARAHMARHMLIRGGINGDRIVRIEGHADRHLKNQVKPFSAENRRIEILILDGKV